MLEPPPVARDPEPEKSSAFAEKISADNDSLKRNMPTFFDTRMSRMHAMSQPAPEPEARPAPPVHRHAAAELPMPPRLPDFMPMAEDGGNVEDAAAQLLRPILRQWLSENMPKIVEKALLTETGFNGHGVTPRR
jgi:hypothetical protein